MGKSAKENEYLVERIVDHKTTRKRDKDGCFDFIELQIKWAGYADTDNTWEPLQNMYMDIKAVTRHYFYSKGYKLECKSRPLNPLTLPCR